MSGGIAEGTVPLQKVGLRLDALPCIVVTRHREEQMVLLTALVIRLYFRTQPLDEDSLMTRLRERDVQSEACLETVGKVPRFGAMRLGETFLVVVERLNVVSLQGAEESAVVLCTHNVQKALLRRE